MEYELLVQSVLDEIDRRIRENIRVEELARIANYSTYHFCRTFAAVTGTPVMNYVVRRKLEYALYDLSQGGRVFDVAVSYGFDTHAGFIKAFKKRFGFPPSLCRLRIFGGAPEPVTVERVKSEYGGLCLHMNPYITVMTPFTIAGRTLRKKMPGIRHHADIPAYCFGVNSAEAEITALCPDPSEFSKSDVIKHCEISMCYDVDPESGEFTYLLGRGIFHPDDLKKIPSDMVSYKITGLYAVFSTPPVVPFDCHEQYAKLIQETWNDIFLKWLPNSEFEYDESRQDFEYYDHRDHGWYFDNNRQMDICIPIRQREEAKRRSQEKGKILWAREMKRRAEIKR